MTALAEFAVDRFPFVSKNAARGSRKYLAQNREQLEESLPKDPSASLLRMLLVGCDAALSEHLRSRLAPNQWNVREAYSGSEAFELLLEQGCEVMLVSPALPDLDLPEFQSLVQTQFPGVQILTVGEATGPHATVEGSSGLALDLRDLLRAEAPASFPAQPSPASRSNAASPQAAVAWQGIIGAAPTMQRVYHAAKLVARRDTSVLIQGESGTGKDLLARAIHNTSPREKQPFVVINCAAIPETLLEAELFGYTKGAFTGASQARMGRVHAAHGGTLFLDEIGELPLPLQSKILRFLEQGEVQRIGGSETVRVDCRVIAATNADLKGLVKANQFREDLYYRLAIFPIQLPALRHRMEDLEALVAEFLRRFCPGAQLSREARSLLWQHNWPGNIRELRNVMERASVLADGRSEIVSDDILL